VNVQNHEVLQSGTGDVIAAGDRREKTAVRYIPHTAAISEAPRMMVKRISHGDGTGLLKPPDPVAMDDQPLHPPKRAD
jgi:hypothetical protein